MWSVALALFLQTSAPVNVLRHGDVVTVVETQSRERYVVRTADISAGGVARFNLACTLADDQRRAPHCEFLSTVAVVEAPARDDGMPAIAAKGRL
jgi:hypothetical protein